MFFSKLKNKDNLDVLVKAVEDLGKSFSSEDEKYWKPDVDKAGNGYAVIRFLPLSEEDETKGLVAPWVQIWHHAFQGTNGWYFENCPTTLKDKCPMCENNSENWNSGIEANKKLVSDYRKRRLNYISNIYVVDDPKHPENNGKTFLFKYGAKIFDKIKFAMKPEFIDEVAIDPFHFWKGANFKLKIRKVDGYQNYDKSEFDSPQPLLDSDNLLEKIYNSEYCLSDIVDPKNFKSYNELKSKMDKVLGLSEKPKLEKSVRRNEVETIEEDEDEDMNYFKSLVEDED